MRIAGAVSSRRVVLALELLVCATATWSLSEAGALGSQRRAAHLPCDKRTAARAVSNTRLGRRMRKANPSPPGWSVSSVYCDRRLAGTSRADMVALFACCTSGAPTPLAIFRPARGRWRLSYSSFKPLIYGLSFKGRTLIEKRPIYHRNDPLCCPSGYTHWRLRWNGSRWTIRRI
jgi:hypothetical protein